MDTPVLLCLYRRLDKVLLLLDALKKIKPAQLYISLNAPNNNKEAFFCDEIKKAVDRIDWDCDIHKKYEPVHISDQAVSITKGIDWFFSNVEYGIILEDDCIPAPSFFHLATFLLQKYKDDGSIYQISGTNINYHHDGPPQLLNAFFSLPPWGWATWKRSWEKYDPQMDNWRQAEDLIKNTVNDFPFWEKLLDSNAKTKKGWDIQWNVDIWKNNGRILMPSYNLVTNIGFDALATFTLNENNILANLPTKDFTLPENHIIAPSDTRQFEQLLITGFSTLKPGQC